LAAANPVTVYLVGAGPGDPGLLTVAAADALRRADVVVYDYLANAQLLDLCPAEAERIYVGKSAGRHTLTQDQINQLLVDKAHEQAQAEISNLKSEISNRQSTIENRQSPRTIVRLKGGDPYVFGRGGEEGEVLRAQGIDFVEIPGITSGIAAPAYAGIPVTHRDFTSTITLITGHEKEEGARGQGVEGSSNVSASSIQHSEFSGVNYEALAKLNGTLVFYMGVKSLPQITQRLIGGGLAKGTPVAVIRWGTHPHQQTVTGTLDTIVDVVQRAGITAPAITIVGRVVALRATLCWFERRPLFGRRILVTRTRQQASDLSTQLAGLGATVIEAPTIELAAPEDWTAIDAALGNLRPYQAVVFTSANGVRAAWQRLRRLGLDARAFGGLQVSAIGPATAAALAEIGIVPDLIPEKFVGEELAAALRQTFGGATAAPLAGERFLLLRADIARPVLREELQKAGAQVDDLPIYRTVRPSALPDDVLAVLRATDGVDWITFTSASTATNLHDLLPEDLRPVVAGIKKLSIGPITTAALNKLSWPPTLEATQHDIPGMVAALRAAKG